MKHSKLLLTGAVALCGLATPAAAGGGVSIIRVEIDYMVDKNHSHKPTPDEIAALGQMFACKGITLVIDVDDAIPHVHVTGCAQPGSSNFFDCTDHANSFQSMSNQYRDQGLGWHYCILGHRYDDGSGTDSSGLGEILGDEFFVADGVFAGFSGASYMRAATFAHELGHNLGLRHAAPNSTGQGPYAPNLASVMSYQYQLRGVKSRMECLDLVGNDHRFKDLDYSSGRLPSVQESLMDEGLGLDIQRVDWNCDGLPSGFVSKSLDSASDWCSQGFGSDVVRDYNEWEALNDVTGSFAFVAGPSNYEVCAPMSQLMLLGGGCATPELSIEPCAAGEMIFIDPNFTSIAQFGTGDNPYRVADWITLVPDHSVVYLQPGAHTVLSSGPLVIDNPVVLTGPGGAVIDP